MNDVTRKWKIYSKLYLLAAMAVAAFFLAVRLFEIERISGKVLFNAGIDVLGLFICIALYFGCIDENRTDIEESTYWLMALILQIGLSFFNNELSWFVAGEPEYRQLYLFLNELTKIYDFSLTALFYNYVRRMLKFEGKLAEWLDSYIYILIIPFSILVLANSFVPINFYVDEQGVFHTLPLYRLVDLYLLIVAPITTLLLIRCKAALKQKIVALSFIVTPILHYILTSGAHGYASQYGSTLFAVTQIYSVLFSDNSRKLASTKTELHLARSVQASIIPKDFFQERKEFDVYASMEPAREVGGDFYDVFLADDDHLVMAMADVSGKGVPSAMYMMVAKIVMKNSAMFGENPASVLRTMNRAICSNNKEEMFVTIWIGVLEISTGILTASNAGHEYPILMRNGRPYEVYKDNHGMVIGAFEDSKYSEYQIAMQPGDKLFLYTDGIPEAMNKNRKQFGMDNLVAALNKTCDKDPEETLQHVRKSVDAFVKGAEQFDDLTMMCIRYNGRKDV